MFEKIYSYLLRLFPSAFRRHYEEESLRLLRDRASDERGFFRRLRLSFDLIADIIGALPQAYRNSYAEVAPAGLLSPQFDGVPSFRVLQQEPIRRGTIIIAGALSITSALVTFTYVMEPPPISYREAARNGPISPIESVIERLNQPISPDSSDSARSDASETSSADIGRLKAPPISTIDAGLSLPGTPSAVSAASQPAQPGGQNLNASYPGHAPLPAISMPSSLASRFQASAQRQQETIRNVTRSINLSGRWNSSLQAGAGDADIPQEFIFRQDSATLTGTGGPDSTEQSPIIRGFVAAGSVRFELNSGRESFLYDLKVEDKELRGTLSIRSANEMRTARVLLERPH
jgi:hypothetical protein